ncbi:MAG: hypothetical protein A3H98_10075 [Bacteroidetes bacterium RIFCSPLOWO2_02_FULL_36_8]|nr:MAG: hypothetical protein A3H98_10075 [Bacteroidetes bacterium RIFCSPLOWO2_02_FULL_36_8]OFY70389.1 MAG: hypothetical protein A3G23_09690 [Bacteroidetes bacterium RIFCSPLOWO2_12_FULL_37_12]
MSRKLFYEFFISFLLFLGLWGVSSYFFSFAEKPIQKINEFKQKKIGKIIVSKIKNAIPVIHNPKMDSAINEIKRRLLNSAGLDTADFNIIVINSQTINAFALPGNHIVIFSELIKFSNNHEEVAAVMAHEIGHLQKGHITKRIIRHVGLGILFSVGGGDPGVIRELIQRILSSVFDREQEVEADNYAFELMAKSGISPEYFAEFFERLKKTHATFPGELEFILSHPHDDKRIENSKNFHLPEDFKERKFEEAQWEEIKEEL